MCISMCVCTIRFIDLRNKKLNAYDGIVVDSAVVEKYDISA